MEVARNTLIVPNRCALLTVVCVLLCVGATPLRGASGARGRPGYSVRQWETDDGLPHGSVITMLQTRDGYLWLGTLGGLVRFDGVRFTVFDPDNTPGLTDRAIVYLFEDSHRILWIGSQSAGTVMMKDGEVVVPAQLAADGVVRRLRVACEDSAGGVWLYFENGEMWRYAENGFTRSTLALPEESRSRTMLQETNGPLWIGAENLQYAIDVKRGDAFTGWIKEAVPVSRLDKLVAREQGGYWRLANARIELWQTNRMQRELMLYPWVWEVTSACEDREGNLVVGTKGAGVFWVSPEGEVTSLSTEGVFKVNAAGARTLISTEARLSHNWALSVVVDREGTVWVGTDGGGLNRVKRQCFEVLEDVRNWSVQSITEDAEGSLWIGSNRNGLGQWTKGTLKRFGPGESIVAVFADRDGVIWFSTQRGELFRFRTGGAFEPIRSGGLIQQPVQAIYQDRAGRLWFASAGGLVRLDGSEWRRFTTSDGLSSDQITSIADDADGNIWVGTQHGGVNCLRGGRITALRKSDGAPSDDVSAVLWDEQGVLWVATFNNGLGRWQNGKWTHYTTREGLETDKLGYLVEDAEGNLWIGSNQGVLRVPKKALNAYASGATTFIPCRAYGKEDGLLTGACTTGSQPGAWRGRDGMLWFSSMKGVAAVNPARLHPNTNPPPVTIETVLIDDTPLSGKKLRAALAEALVLQPGEERLEIQYASLNLGAPDRARFRYRLEDYEKDWREAGNSRMASYTKLSSGHYTFHVTAANEDGVWNDVGQSLAVIVQPPFWQTWWFIGVTAVCVFGLVAGIVHYLSTQKLQRQLAIMRQHEALEKERARIARDIHDQVGASLTQVALLGELVESDKDSPQEVEAHAQQISQAARETTRALDEIVWTVNPQNDTLEGLVNYICKYAQDYLAVAGVRYRFDLPAELPTTPIAPEMRHNVFLASKEAVTNIVRHAKAGAAWIRLRLEPSSVILEIEDNGRGVAGMDMEAAGRRNGLKNMRKRMEDVGGTFSIGPGQEGGALVRLTVPLQTRSANPET